MLVMNLQKSRDSFSLARYSSFTSSLANSSYYLTKVLPIADSFGSQQLKKPVHSQGAMNAFVGGLSAIQKCQGMLHRCAAGLPEACPAELATHFRFSFSS